MLATIIPFPTKRQAAKIRQKAMRNMMHDAIQHGFVCLNDSEKKLIKLLRYTSHDGRDYVMKVAETMREKQPWVSMQSH